MFRAHSLVAATPLGPLVPACGTGSSEPLRPRPEPTQRETNRALMSQAFQFQSRGKVAFASFFSSDPSGCVDTLVGIDVVEQSRCGREVADG
jgi:hypothetical protein